MFIRAIKSKRQSANGDTVYEYLQLVESYRTAEGPRQKLLLDLGSLPLKKEEFKEFIAELKSRLSGQMNFLRKKRADSQLSKMVEDTYEKLVRKQNIAIKPEPSRDIQKIDAQSITISHSRSIGAEHVCYSIWKELKLSEWLSAEGVSESQIGIIVALVTGRLINPGSELATKNWLENQSGLKDIISSLQDNPSQISYYRAGDQLFSLKDKLEAYLSRTESDIFELKDSIYLYDMTNTYFEGNVLANPKAKYGRSKEKRSDCKLITLGMVVDHLGFAKNSQLFAGNQAEAYTLEKMISLLSKQNNNQLKTIVIDAGIATADNIKWLKENGYYYIVCHRGKPPFELDKSTITTEIQSIYQENTLLTVSTHIYEEDIYLRCKSKLRECKEHGIRSREEQKFIDQLEHYSKIIESGKKRTFKMQTEMIGRLKERFSKVAKLYNISIKTDPNSNIKDMDKIIVTKISWKKNEPVYNDQIQNEGVYILRTNRKGLNESEIWNTYIMLTRLETAFRHMKSWLGLRPIFHSKEERTDAHLFISVIAYHIAHIIEYKLRKADDSRSWWSIRSLLSSHQTMIMEYNELADENHWLKHHITMCSDPEESIKEIYKKLKIPILPFKRREKIYDKL